MIAILSEGVLDCCDCHFCGHDGRVDFSSYGRTEAGDAEPIYVILEANSIPSVQTDADVQRPRTTNNAAGSVQRRNDHRKQGKLFLLRDPHSEGGGMHKKYLLPFLPTCIP